MAKYSKTRSKDFYIRYWVGVGMGIVISPILFSVLDMAGYAETRLIVIGIGLAIIVTAAVVDKKFKTRSK